MAEKGMCEKQIEELKAQSFSSFTKEQEENLEFFNAMQNPVALKDYNGEIMLEHVYCKPAVYDALDKNNKVILDADGNPEKQVGLWLLLIGKDADGEWCGYKTSSLGVLNAIQNLIQASKRPLPWSPPVKVFSERVPGKNGKELRTLKLVKKAGAKLA